MMPYMLIVILSMVLTLWLQTIFTAIDALMDRIRKKTARQCVMSY
jgi:diacylglycerol kinase